MKGRCINNSGFTGILTMGKIYDLEYYIDETWVMFKGDNNRFHSAYAYRFRIYNSKKFKLKII